MPPDDPPAVEQPKHPLHALTTFELRDYRRQLERAHQPASGGWKKSVM